MARRRNFALLLCILAALLLGSPVARGGVIVTPVGTPVFQVADLHLFSAPTGASSQQTFQALFPQHSPRVVHLPSYDQELTAGLALTGFPEREVFPISEFTFPRGIHLGFLLLPGPGAPSGASFDFADGPIIPNSDFPILGQGDVFRNGAPFELGAFGLNITQRLGGAGASHIVADVFEDSSFAPPGVTDLTGAYEYRLTFRDTGGNGYNLVAQFQVQAVPEPSTLTLFGVATLSLAGSAWRRRKRVSGSA